MPKIKTRRAAAKRFKKTGAGKWMQRKSHHRHLLLNKPRKNRRSYKGAMAVDPTDVRRVERLLPNAG